MVVQLCDPKEVASQEEGLQRVAGPLFGQLRRGGEPLQLERLE